MGKTRVIGWAGRRLQNLLVDDLHEIIDRANRFSGNAYSSRKNYGPMPDAPKIPVETSYGIEIKGVSLDQLLSSWKHVRFYEFQVSGDLLIGARDQTIRVRYLSPDRANSFKVGLPALTSTSVEDSVSRLSLDLIKDIHPETAARYLISLASACNGSCENAWQTAINFCWGWTQRHPESALPFYYLGYAVNRTAHPEDAIGFLDRAIMLDSRLDAAFIAKGDVLDRLQNFPGARSAYERALQIRKSPNPYLDLGVMSGEQGRYPEARDYYIQALAIDSNYVGAHINLGYTLLQLSKAPEAVQAFRMARYLDPGNPAALSGLADALVKNGKADEAQHECETAARLNPDDSWPLIVRARVFRKMGRAQQAVEQLQSVIRTRGNSWEASSQLAIAYFQRGDLVKARLQIESLLKQDFEDATGHRVLAEVLKAQGNLRDSEQESVRAESRWPELKYLSIDDL